MSDFFGKILGLHVYLLVDQPQPDMLGLSTLRALELLYNQLSGILEEHQKQEMRRVWKLSWRRCFLHHSNLGSTFHWPGAGLMLLASVLLFCCYGGQPYGSEGVELVSGAALLFLLLCNLYMMHRQGQLKRQEIPRRLQGILKELDAIIHNSVQSAIPLWSSTAYPELLLPHSQAIGLQWAFRDGRLINLPATLLVEGDIISLRPGQQAPASLRGMKEDEHLLLAPGDLYFQSTPLSSPLHRDRSLPQSPHTPGNFRVTQTPVIEDVRRCLNEGTSRPVSVLNNECYALRTLLHKYVVPVTLAILLLTNILRFIFHAPGIGPWKYTLIQLQVNGVLPLLPLLFPVLWVLLNAYGEAKVLVQFSETPPVVLDMWLYEWRNVLAILAGRSPALCCTASVLHHLGSVTVLCCVDKQGILSWPNPSPEKVAFFSSRVGPETDYPPEHASFGSADGSEEDRETELCFITETASRPLEEDEQKYNVEGQRLSVRPSPRRWNVCCKPTSMAVVSFSKGVDGGKEDVEIGSEANVEDSKEEEETEEEKDNSQRSKVPPPVIISEDPDNETEDFVCDYRFETLSLSQDQQNPAAVQFDDSRWPLHAASLKPLGLNVLLSACSGSLAERTLRLCDHLASEALEGRASTVCLPPQPLCGLCDLPKLIGFMPSARDVFTIESYVALYQPPTLSRGRDVGQDIVRRLPAAVKHRLPLPHLLSLLVRDMNSGALQLLSHGTADLILEGSTDLWDGSDIYPLSPSDRKKVLDFYQRACLSGHCTAFSYKPMSRTLSRHLNGHCIELQVENDVSSGPGLPSSHEGGVSIKLGTRNNSWSSDEGIAEIQDRADCVQALSGQIFMGLVSTQYQAQIDIVRLIDRLDNACIRFVYFSLEDELRSKVFAEKMGLETGWNCHISLQSSGYEAGIDGPHGTSQAGSLHENTHQDGETQQLLEEETHSDVVSYPPTDSDAPSIVECSNRAKLPRGIENIRPHLANIDNVPLLVPLFTDCTPDKICEMVQIMQEYGEVVCCLGSSANEKNSHVFLQSNVSLALDPLYPSRCTWDGFSYGRSANTTAAATATAVEVMENEVLDPLHISTLLNSLPCSISFQNEKNMSLIKLVKQARHMTNSMRKCSLFLLQCQLCIMLVQVLACFLQLPPPLSTTDILWLSCFAHPLISISLLGNCPDDAVMTVATGKNLQFLPNKTVQYFVLCFFGKFFLSICTILSCFVLTLQSSCVTATAMHNGTQCRSILFSEVDGLRWFEDLSNGLLLAQKLTAAFLLLGHLCISVSQVHRSKPLWSKTPFSNIWWAATIPTLLLFQALHTVISLSLWRNADGRLDLTASVVPMTVWLLGFLGLVPLLIVNELVKLHEIRMRERSQKRQKLQFETKLGMNSPF